jgi:hypothetical protein
MACLRQAKWGMHDCSRSSSSSSHPHAASQHDQVVPTAQLQQQEEGKGAKERQHQSSCAAEHRTSRCRWCSRASQPVPVHISASRTGALHLSAPKRASNGGMPVSFVRTRRAQVDPTSMLLTMQQQLATQRNRTATVPFMCRQGVSGAGGIANSSCTLTTTTTIIRGSSLWRWW